MQRLSMLAALLLLPAAAVAQVTVDWVEPTTGVSVAVDGSGNVFTVNYVYNPGGDIVLTKRGPDGVLRWTASFDQTEPSKWERAAWVETDAAGNAIVAGTRMSGYSNPVEAASILMKFDPNGQLLWRRVFETDFDGSSLRRCLVDEAGNIYALGLGSGPPGFVTKIKKFTPDGDPVWTYFDSHGIGAPVNFKFTPDGALLVAARAIYGSLNGYAKVDRDGNHVWSLAGVQSLTVGDAAGDAAGNTYVVHGEYVSNGGTVVRKLSPTGATLWSRTFALSGFRVEVGRDGLPVVCGFPNPNSGGASFVKVGAAGDLVWANADADGPLALLLHARLLLDAEDNAYLAAGTLFEMAVCKVTRDGASAWTALVSPGGYAQSIALGRAGEVFVVGGSTARLVEPNGSVAVGDPAAPAGLALAPARPNPCAGATRIRYALPAEARVSLGVYDVAGRRVRVLADGVAGPGEHEARFDAAGLAEGIYVVRLEAGGAVLARKLTVLR